VTRARTSAPRYTQLAMTRVPLNIPFTCDMNPVRNPVLPSASTLPTVYRMANFVGFIHIREERKEQNSPAL
jgi:hypothetical protein